MKILIYKNQIESYIVKMTFYKKTASAANKADINFTQGFFLLERGNKMSAFPQDRGSGARRIFHRSRFLPEGYKNSRFHNVYAQTFGSA